MAGLAARLYLGGAGAPRRYFAWGQAVRRAVLAVMLVHAVRGLDALVRLAWSHRLFGWLPAPPASMAPAPPGGIWPTVWYAGRLRLDRGLRGAGPRALPHCPGHRGAGHRPRPGRAAAGAVHRQPAVAALGPWAFWVLLDLAPVLAMAAFHRDAPPAARRPWLLALPAGYLLVDVPVLAVQATGNSAWLPDFSGLCCVLVALACLAHAPRAWSRRAAGSGVWSLTLTLLAAVAGAYRIVSLSDYLHDPHLIQVSLAELLILVVAVALVAPDAARAQAAMPAPPPHPHTGMSRLGGPRTCRSSPRRACAVLASVLAAGIVLTVGQLQPRDPARAGRGCHPAAATSSAVTVRPASHARPAPRARGRVPGRLRHAPRRRKPWHVLPQDRHAGDDHLRSGLPGLPIPAAPASRTAGGTRPVRILDHRARCRRAGADSSHHGG